MLDIRSRALRIRAFAAACVTIAFVALASAPPRAVADPADLSAPEASPSPHARGGDPLLGTPFQGTRLSKLVLDTPGVVEDDARSGAGKLYVRVNEDEKKPLVGGRRGTGSGFVRFDAIVAGQTIDADWLMAIPIESEAQGAFVALVYRSTGGPAEYLATIDSNEGGLELSFHDGHLFATAPIFAKNDPPCCPSKRIVQRLLYSPSLRGLTAVTTQTLDANDPSAATSAPR